MNQNPYFKAGCQGIVHVIKEGDTLYKLGKLYKVSVAGIMYANPYVNVYNLQIGDELCIPVYRENIVNPFNQSMINRNVINRNEDMRNNQTERMGVNPMQDSDRNNEREQEETPQQNMMRGMEIEQSIPNELQGSRLVYEIEDDGEMDNL